MISLLTVYSLISHGTQALPIQDVVDKNVQSCRDLGHCRTIWDIIWSCLVIIFSCTWIAIHPNIPAQDEGWSWRALRQLGIFIIALIAPELIILWAMRQWVSARKLAKKYKSHEWTMTHGFFAVMGGFMLYEENTPKFTLDPWKLEQYLISGQIKITEDEINDRSKGDILTKGLVLFQTTWFILQLIARAVKHLSITKLEIATLAFASLNFITYSVWWSKPLNVEFPVHVYKNTPSHKYVPQEDIKEYDSKGDMEDQTGIYLEFLGRAGTDVSGSTHPSDEGTDRNVPKIPWFFEFVALMKNKVLQVSFVLQNTPHRALRMLRNIPHRVRHTFKRPSDSFFTEQWGEADNLLNVMLFPFQLMVGPLNNYELKPGAHRVHTFYSGSSVGWSLMFVVSVIAMVFGGVHCVAWAFHFPTNVEQIIWRVSSILVTAFPVATFVLGLTSRKVNIWFLKGVLRYLAIATVVITFVLYPLARLALLVQAFMTLRSLPPDAFDAVHWTTFIPHIY